MQKVEKLIVKLRIGPPGTGKTHKFFDDFRNREKKEKWMYHTYSHDAIKERMKHLSAEELKKTRHWEGLQRKCPCLDTDEDGVPYNEKITRLVDLEFPNNIICTVCKEIQAFPQKECPYRKQFENLHDVELVLAPPEYEFTKWVFEYKPDVIAFDDCSMCKKILPKKESLEHQLQRLMNLTNQYQHIDSKITLEQLNNAPNYKRLMKKLKRAYRRAAKKFVNDMSDFDKSFLVSPDDIDAYCKLARAHGYQSEYQFAIPAIFYAFDYAVEMQKNGNKVRIKIIDAKPNQKFLKDVLCKRYKQFRKVSVELEQDNFNPTLIDRSSVVYEVHKKGTWYPRKSLENPDTRVNIKKKIQSILDIDYHGNTDLKIGIILMKPEGLAGLTKSEKELRIQLEARFYVPREYTNVEVETFGNQRGKNSLEKCNPLFIIGTYNINKYEIAQEFFYWYARPPATIEVKEKEPHGGPYHYLDPELESFRRMFEEVEMYQAIHRSRLWLYKKQVYVFGLVPEEIRNEGVKVVEQRGDRILNKERVEWLLNYMKKTGEQPASWARDDMAKHFRISKNRAYTIIRAIVKENKNVRSEKRRSMRWLVFVPTKEA